jgi:Protein of unknown function (DUF4232)
MRPDSTARRSPRPAVTATASLAGLAAAVLGVTAACSPAPQSATAGASRPVSATASPTAGGSAAARTSAARTSTAASTPAAAAGASANAAGACATSTLKAATGPANGAAGSAYVPIRFTNVSSRTCTLSGYPGVSFVTGPTGSQVGNAADRMPPPNGLARPVALAPGAVASAVLQIADAGNFYPASRCRPASGPYLRVYPPGQTGALFIRTGFGAGVACASRAVTTLHVGPVQPGASPASGG